MDFVQRNLINERNNLQIELAKAKIRIAQLNESAVEGPSTVEGLKKVIQDAHADKDLSLAGAQLAASATNELRKMGEKSHGNADHHFGDLKPFDLSEQAEYISDLENVIATIAESINVSAADLYETYRALQKAELLKELNVSSAFKQGGIRGAVNAIKGNIKNRGLLSTTVGAIGGRDGLDVVSGAEHGAVINRVQKEVKSGKRSASSGDKAFDRVQGHYTKMRGDDNEKAGNLTRDGRIIKDGRILRSPLGDD